MQPPVFVRGHLHFEVDGFQLEYVHQSLSLFGVTGLPWAPLNPEEHFGREVKVTLKTATRDPLQMTCPARITREATRISESLGLRFQLSESQTRDLQKRIQSEGFYPTEYVRKYPRIPSSSRIPTFPLRTLMVPEVLPEAATRLEGAELPMILSIYNLSPTGMLAATEDARAVLLPPDSRVRILLESRGWFPTPIQAQGLICRTVDDHDPFTQNLTRYFGIRFTRMSDKDKEVFRELMKNILLKMKSSL
jgi:hypothetical protein